MGIHPSGPERDFEREAPLTLSGLPLPGARPRCGGEENEQEPRECHGWTSGAARILGGPSEALPPLEEFSHRPVEPGREGDVKPPLPGPQHSLPHSRLPNAERTSRQIRPTASYSSLGEKEDRKSTRLN